MNSNFKGAQVRMRTVRGALACHKVSGDALPALLLAGDSGRPGAHYIGAKVAALTSK